MDTILPDAAVNSICWTCYVQCIWNFKARERYQCLDSLPSSFFHSQLWPFQQISGIHINYRTLEETGCEQHCYSDECWMQMNVAEKRSITYLRVFSVRSLKSYELFCKWIFMLIIIESKIAPGIISVTKREEKLKPTTLLCMNLSLRQRFDLHLLSELIYFQTMTN